MNDKVYKKVLTIAGSDSGGGAGIQADLKTFSAIGTYGMSVITALTAQNTKEVRSIYSVTPAFVKEQLQTVLSDIGADAIKIGMLHDPEIIKTISDTLKLYKPTPIVLDPVMISKGGSKLLKDEAVIALKEELLPFATVITPNIPETSVLTSHLINSEEDMITAGKTLLKQGAKSAVIKGGHLLSDNSPDLFIDKNTTKWFDSSRISTNNTHGTGCTFSSAITAYLAKGLNIIDAVSSAKEYTFQALKEGAKYSIGTGHGPVHHFWKFWE